MTDKQQIFADEYLKDLNGTRAYKVAYPSVKKDETARANASRLLTNANVKKYIDEQLEKMHNDRTADAQEVLEYLTAVMRGEHQEQTLIGDGDGYQKVVDLKPSVQTRRSAAVDIGKRYALFTDKTEVAITEMPVFVDDIGEPDG